MSNDYIIKRAQQRLTKLIPGKVATDKVLAKMTTLRVGGPASIFLTVDTLADLRAVLQVVRDFELSSLILGRGSNILASDKGFRGIVFQLGRDFNQTVVEKNEIRAGAAVTLTSLVQSALKNSLGGLAFAVGIPGTLGAAIAINAGAHGAAVGDIVRNVTYYTDDLRLQRQGPDHLDFGYRTSGLPKNAIVVEATLALSLSSAEIIKSQMETNWRRRKTNQPSEMPNAGSMFKNPTDHAAGKLIEEAGCKGQTIGGAQVSEKHANFFMNTGGATAADFYWLMQDVTAKVEAASGIKLEPEVKIIGDWSYAAR